MDEKAKMLGGYLYKAMLDKRLADERNRAKTLCERYNRIPRVRLEAEGGPVLAELFGRVGKNCLVEQPFYCDYGYNIEVGDNFYTNHILVILDVLPVRFGDNVMIGPNCGFYAASHPLDAALRRDGWEDGAPITVGDDVWIGGNVVVMPGVEIGSGTVVGAGSVVTKNVPAGVLAVGNPCRVLREITPEDAHRHKMYLPDDTKG